MCNDVSLIAGLRQAVKSTSAEICKAYNDFSQDTIGDALKSVLSRQLRIAEKLSSIEKLYSTQKSIKIMRHQQRLMRLK